MRVWKSIKSNWKTVLIYLTIIFSITVIGRIIYQITLPEIVLFLLVGTFVFLLFYDTYKRSKAESLVYGSKSFRKSYEVSPTYPIVTNFDKIPNAAKLVEELSYYDRGIFKGGDDVREVAAEAINRHFDKIPNAAKIIERLANDKDEVVRCAVVEVLDHHFDKIPNAAKIIEELGNKGHISIPILQSHFDKIPNAPKFLEMAINDDGYKNARYLMISIIDFNFDKIPNAVRMLEKLVQDENSDVRKYTIEIIKNKWNYPAGIYRNKFSESFVKEILSETESDEIEMLRNLISGEINEEKSRQISNFVERILSEYRNENKIALCKMLLENFYKFPNPEKIVERMLNKKDREIKCLASDILAKHFDKLQNSSILLERLINDTNPDGRALSAEIIMMNFNKISDAEKIIEKLVIEYPTSPFTLDIGHLISKHIDNIKDIQKAQKILEILANDIKHVNSRCDAVDIAIKNINKIPNAVSILKKLKNDENKLVRDYANAMLKRQDIKI